MEHTSRLTNSEVVDGAETIPVTTISATTSPTSPGTPRTNQTDSTHGKSPNSMGFDESASAAEKSSGKRSASRKSLNFGELSTASGTANDATSVKDVAKTLVAGVLSRASLDSRVVSRHIGLRDSQTMVSTLDDIWENQIDFQEVRSVLSVIWSAENKEIVKALLSDIWEVPAIQAILSDIWESPIFPQSIMSEIWTDAVSYHDVRSILSEIWSSEHRLRVRGVLSEIWSMPGLHSLLSEIWNEGRVRSILSSIWDIPVQLIDVRSVLSQIWSTEHDMPRPLSMLSQIWQIPALQSELSRVWTAPRVQEVLSEIWAMPIETVDVRSVLSQIWSKEFDEFIISILSAIWTDPVMQTILSEIWKDGGKKELSVKKVHRQTDSEMAYEEVMDHMEVPEPELSSHSLESDIAVLSEKRVLHVAPKPRTRDGRIASAGCLAVEWAFGRSSWSPVLNLTDCQRTSVAYITGHMAVIYDYQKHDQRLLQGHRHSICALAASVDGRWLVTSDAGAQSCLLVWSTDSGRLLQVYFCEQQDETARPLAMTFTDDSRYVILVWMQKAVEAAAERSHKQLLLYWDWTAEQADPQVVYEFRPGQARFNHLSVSHSDLLMFATTNTDEIVFFKLDPDVTNASGRIKIETHEPMMKSRYSVDFQCQLGVFCATAFSDVDAQSAVTGTSKGYLILWSSRLLCEKSDADESSGYLIKEARKVVETCTEAITTVQYVDGLICVITQIGRLTFFDENLLLVRHVKNTGLGSIRSISFDLIPSHTVETVAGEMMAENQSNPEAGDQQQQGRALVAGGEHVEESEQSKQLAVRNCVVCTADGSCVLMNTSKFRCQTLFQFSVSDVQALAVYRDRPQVLVGAHDGALRLFDSQSKRLVYETRLHGEIRCLAVSPSGIHAVAGLHNGHLHLLDALTLQPGRRYFTVSRSTIDQCLFSADSTLLAARDADRVIDVYLDGDDGFQLQTRFRAHHEPIVQMMFVPPAPDTPQRLLSLSIDRRLVEYDLENSTMKKPIILRYASLEQQALPLSMDWYPDLRQETCFITANSEYKLKLFNFADWKCLKIAAGAQYGEPVQQIRVIPITHALKTIYRDEVHSYMAFSSGAQLGLQVLPIDGNPHKISAVIGHPVQVKQLECSTDGKYLFSSGEKDGCVFMWSVDTGSLEALLAGGGQGMVPFYNQMSYELCEKLQDVIYFTQLEQEGEDFRDGRGVSSTVAIHNIPDIMRTVGYFPTEQECTDMIHELQHRSLGDHEQVDRISLNDVVLIYLNHKPVTDDSADQLKWALETLLLGTKQEGRLQISRGKFLKELQTSGDRIDSDELTSILTELVDPQAEFIAEDATLDTVKEYLPKMLGLDDLCGYLLRQPGEVRMARDSTDNLESESSEAVVSEAAGSSTEFSTGTLTDPTRTFESFNNWNGSSDGNLHR